MSALARRGSRGLAEIFDWLEPPHVLLHPFAGQPIEERVEHGRYVVRAEMPGIDPEKQAEITLSRGILTIHAERDPVRLNQPSTRPEMPGTRRGHARKRTQAPDRRWGRRVGFVA